MTDIDRVERRGRLAVAGRFASKEVVAETSGVRYRQRLTPNGVRAAHAPIGQRRGVNHVSSAGPTGPGAIHGRSRTERGKSDRVGSNLDQGARAFEVADIMHVTAMAT